MTTHPLHDACNGVIESARAFTHSIDVLRRDVADRYGEEDVQLRDGAKKLFRMLAGHNGKLRRCAELTKGGGNGASIG